MIDHSLLDHYERTAGELQKVPQGHGIAADLWEILDELMLDLHLIRHGYADEGYARHVERELTKVCEDASVIERVKALRI
ncbi:MAG: hypothetical protein WEC15_01120 [Flavobacteriales bacterium]